MALTTRLKSGLNAVLRPVNVHVDSLTAETHALERLRGLDQSGYFDQAVFPVPPAFTRMDCGLIWNALETWSRRFDDFEHPSRNQVGYCLDNGFFYSPDAEVLYCVVRQFRPGTILEVGSGHSTKLSRQAIIDGDLNA